MAAGMMTVRLSLITADQRTAGHHLASRQSDEQRSGQRTLFNLYYSSNAMLFNCEGRVTRVVAIKDHFRVL